MASPQNTSRTRLQLDSTVVSVELTLLSIIQGVVQAAGIAVAKRRGAAP